MEMTGGIGNIPEGGSGKSLPYGSGEQGNISQPSQPFQRPDTGFSQRRGSLHSGTGPSYIGSDINARMQVTPPDGSEEGESTQAVQFKIFSHLVWESASIHKPIDQKRIEAGLTIAKLKERGVETVYPRDLFRELAKTQGDETKKPAEMLGNLTLLSAYLRKYIAGQVITAQRHETESGMYFSYSIGQEFDPYAKDMYTLMRYLSATLPIFSTELINAHEFNFETLPVSMQIGQELTGIFFDRDGNPIPTDVTVEGFRTKFRENTGREIPYHTLTNQLEYFEHLGIIKRKRGTKSNSPVQIIPDNQFPSLFTILSSLEKFQKGDRTVLTNAYAFDALLDKYPAISQGLARALWTLDEHVESIDRTKTLETIQAQLSDIIYGHGQITVEQLVSQPAVNRFDPRTWSALLFLVRDRPMASKTRNGSLLLVEPVQGTKEEIMNILRSGGIFEADVEKKEQYFEKTHWQVQRDFTHVHAYSRTNRQASIDQIITKIPEEQLRDLGNPALAKPNPVRRREIGTKSQLFVNIFGNERVQFSYDEKKGITSKVRYHDDLIKIIKTALKEAYASKMQPIPDDAQLDLEVESLFKTIAKKDI